ncbi:MAG: FkbM family methyltransferase [Pseudomonas sp.]|uniref:FkbM family methyltransferase n=1 Tax=Pseudomonas sp. TaxID=306 RepID=UPI00339ABADA
MSRMISYAQNFEDVILERIFKDQSDGFYVDIGACHPIYDSVTHHFYLKGWQGVNLEPQPVLFDELTAVRPRDINLRCCAGQQAGQLSLAITKDIGTSTLDPELAEVYRREQAVVEEISVSVVTLNQVWDEHVGTRQVDFLKIDVEGFEKNVLLGADFEKVAPALIVIEATRPNSDRLCHEQWESLLLGHYVFFYFDGLNRFYQRKGLALPGCSNTVAPNVFDQFKTYPQILLERANARLHEERLELTRQLQGAQGQVVDKEVALAAAADAYQDLQLSFQVKADELQCAQTLLQGEEIARTGSARERLPATESPERAGQCLLEEFNGALLTEREDLREQLQIAFSHLADKEQALADAATAYQSLQAAYQIKEDELRKVLGAWRRENIAQSALGSDHAADALEPGVASLPSLLEQFNALLLDEREALREQLKLAHVQSLGKEQALLDAADAYQALAGVVQAKEAELQHAQELLGRKEEELLDASQTCQRLMSAHELQYSDLSNLLQQHSLGIREANSAYESLQNEMYRKDTALAEAAQAHSCLQEAFDEKLKELETLHATLAARSWSAVGEVKESH